MLREALIISVHGVCFITEQMILYKRQNPPKPTAHTRAPIPRRDSPTYNPLPQLRTTRYDCPALLYLPLRPRPRLLS